MSHAAWSSLPSGTGRRRVGIRFGLRFGLFIGLIAGILGSAAPGFAASHIVQARNYAFIAPAGGSALSVAVGDEVTWIVSSAPGTEPHTVTSGAPFAIDNRFPDHPATDGFLMPGDSFTTTFATAGTFPYFCELHPEQMTGTVTVGAAATPAPTKAPTPQPTLQVTAPPSPTPAPTPIPTPLASPSLDASASDLPSPQVSPSATAAASATPAGTPPPTGGSGEAGSGADAGPLPIVLAGLIGVGLVAGLLAARRRGRAGRAG
jgi:plastocyanin